MNSKIIQWLVAAAAISLAVCPAVYVGLKTNEPSVEVTIETPPDTINCVVGQLVQVKARGENAAWSIEPEIEDAIFFGTEQEHFVASFRTAGRYVVIEASIVAGVTTISKTVCVVGGGTVETGWAVKIREWGPPSNSAAVAASFRSIADFIDGQTDAGVLVTPAKILELTTAGNKKTGSSGAFFDRLAAELAALQASGELTTQRDYSRVWKAIAEALESQ